MAEDINLVNIDKKYEAEAFKILPKELRYLASKFSEKSVEAYKILVTKEVELSNTEKADLSISISKQIHLDALNALLNAGLTDKANLNLANQYTKNPQILAIPILLSSNHPIESSLIFTASNTRFAFNTKLKKETEEWSALKLGVHPELAMKIDDSPKLEALQLLLKHSSKNINLAPQFDSADHIRALKATVENPDEALKFISSVKDSSRSVKTYQFKAFELKPLAHKAAEVKNAHALDIYKILVNEETNAIASQPPEHVTNHEVEIQDSTKHATNNDHLPAEISSDKHIIENEAQTSTKSDDDSADQSSSDESLTARQEHDNTEAVEHTTVMEINANIVPAKEEFTSKKSTENSVDQSALNESHITKPERSIIKAELTPINIDSVLVEQTLAQIEVLSGNHIITKEADIELPAQQADQYIPGATDETLHKEAKHEEL